ncbi:hypothetical protein DBR17_11535 [Sphingomonas sp. HMWF008]|nr:hypothetical protein DBR17_11535 [Sphingomonas sp. HMWF008]
MALKIVEFFGYEPYQREASPFVTDRQCPFTRGDCIKPDHGACSVKQVNSGIIICCPNRLYADDYRALSEVGHEVFGQGTELITASDARLRKAQGTLTGNQAVLFGKRWGGELPLPRPPRADGGKAGSYYVDWIVAKIDQNGELLEFTALEVQSIDTTGNYGDQAEAYFEGKPFPGMGGRGYSDADMNWENVNKRILPQLIYKGHVLRREAKCSKGLFFICPHSVYQKIMDRLGNHLHAYPIGNGTITFRSYGVGDIDPATHQRPLLFDAQFTTTIDQVATAFTSPMNLPPQDVYAAAIAAALR